jgi:hypothetical protein
MERDKQYQLFFSNHYTIEIEQSYRPIFSSNRMSFPSKRVVIKKKLTLADKLRYYWSDLLLWNKERKQI